MLDSSVQIFDAELSAANNFNGATLTLVNSLGANAQDVYSASGLLGALTQGGSLVVSGTIIGTVTSNSAGTLLLTFNSSATQTLVNSAMSAIAYSNTSHAPPASVQINWSFSDGNTSAQGSGGPMTASGSTTVTITAVNDAPTITNAVTIGMNSVNENTTSDGSYDVSFILSMANWADADAGALQGMAITGVAAHGTWQYSTDGVTWSGFGAVSSSNALLLDANTHLRYVPDGMNAEVAIFTFKAWDQTTDSASTNSTPAYADPGTGGGTTAYSSQTANTSITVTAVNDAPTLGGAVAGQAVNDNASIAPFSGFTIADVDIPAQTQSVSVTLDNAAKGSFTTLNGFTAAGAGVYTFSGTAAAAQAAIQGLVFTPTANRVAAGSTETTRFTVSVNDGVAPTVTDATTSVVSTSINDAPTLATPAAALYVDTAALDSFSTDSGVLVGNDVDVSSTLVYGIVGGTVAGGVSTLVGTYGTLAVTTATGAYTYTPDAAAINGLTANNSDNFSVTVTDGALSATASYSVNIIGANDASVLSSATVNLTETNVPLTASGALTISDADSPATFVPQAATAGAYGSFAIDTAGAWSYTASSAHNEFVAGTTYTDSFAVTSADGTPTSVTVNILGTNDAAVLSSATVNLTQSNVPLTASGALIISDVDSPATFVAQTATNGSYGSFAIDTTGAWSYTASSAHTEFVAGTNYTDSFAVVSADGTPTSVIVNIAGTNDPAVLSSATVNLIQSNVPLTASGALIISDVDSPATFVAQTATNGSYGSFAIDTTGAWSYTASSAHTEFVAGTTYTDSCAVVSADGTPTSVIVNILGSNDAPVANNDSVAGNENAVLSGNVLVNDSDAQGSSLSANLVLGPAHGSLTLNANGSFSYAPVANWNGTDTFSYKANDGSADSNVATVTLIVNPVNLAPTTLPVTLAPIAENSGPRLITQAELLLNAVDVDGQSLTATALAISSGAGALVDNGNGTWSYAPAPNDSAAVVFSYTVTDGSLSAAGLAALAITPTAAAPTIPTELPPMQPPTVVPAVPVASAAATAPVVVVAAAVAQPVVAPTTVASPTVPAKATDAPAPTFVPIAQPAFVFANLATSLAQTTESSKPAVAVIMGEASLTSRLVGASELREMLRFLPMKSGIAADFSAWAVDASTTQSLRAVQGAVAAPTATHGDEQVKGVMSFDLSGVDASHIVGIVLSAGLATWSISASGLMAALLVSVPVWRNIDPLPILAPEEDKPQWNSDDEQDLEEAAMSGLWRVPAGYELEEDMG